MGILNVANIWQEFLQVVTEEVGSRVVETWFKAITLTRWDAASKTVYLKAPNAFIKDWIVAHYSTLLKSHLSRLLSEQRISLLFLDESKVTTTQLVQTAPRATSGTIEQAVTVTASKHVLNPAYQFESFVVGPHNALAYAAALAVADAPGTLYNPLCIYGGPGLGKTHLLQAVGNRVRATNPKARILYQSADRFVHEFITAIRFDKIAPFEKRYREVDVLLIDDVQCIAHKAQTQEAFFQIFNSLYESGKQIVFSSNALPGTIDGVSDRLRSRLDGGLIADLQIPTLETKIAILQKKADAQKESLSDDVAHYIATRVQSNVRELEGLLIRVLAFATLTHQAINLDLAHKVLMRTSIESTRSVALDLPRIADKIAKHYNFSIHQLRSTKRQKTISLARHVGMYFMKKKTDHSLIDIATFWHRKDHSTVIHAIEKIEQLKQADSSFMEELSRLEQLLHR